jgi:hypothetical protein
MTLSVWHASTTILEEPAPSVFRVKIDYLEDKAADSSKMLVSIYQAKLSHIPEHCNPNIQCHENLKSPTEKYLTLKARKTL